MSVEEAFEGEHMEQKRDAYLHIVSEKSPQFGVSDVSTLGTFEPVS